ncbi:MAG: hypothetical protein IJB97_08910 [Clostridia bacterium]|nr:hypothetical protein [Clostridia bacterium]
MVEKRKTALCVLISLLMFISVAFGVLCFSKVEKVVAEDGTEISLTAAAAGTEGNVFTPVKGFGYSPSNSCLYITNNGGTVEGAFKIPEITATDYEYIIVYVGNMWGTPGAEDIYWNFYNANGYDAETSAPAHTYVQGKTMAGTGNKTLCYATIPVSDIVDGNGAVSEIVVEAYDGAKNTSGMQMYIYGVTLKERAKAAEHTVYNTGKTTEVPVDGSAFTLDASKSTAAQVSAFAGNDTKVAKLYANGMFTGKMAYLDFGGALDSKKYTTITLVYGKANSVQMEIGFYKADDVTTPVETQTMTCNKYEGTVNPAANATMSKTLNLKAFSDKDGMVEGLYIKTEDDVSTTVANLAIYGITIGEPNYLSTVNLSLRGDIGVQFNYVLTDELLNDENASVKFTCEDKAEKTLPLTDVIADEDGEYGFIYEIAAPEMTNVISVAVYNGAGFAMTKTYSCSVYDYCNYVITACGDTHPAYDLAKALLNYGGYAQTYFNYKTDNLANKNLTDETLPETVDVKAWEIDEQLKSDIQISTVLNSTTSVRIYLSETVKDNYAVTFEGDALDIKQKTGANGETEYYVEISDIPAAYLSQTLKIVFTEVSTNETYVVKTSALSYAKAVVDGSYSQSLQNLVKALYAYSLVAEEYFGIDK